MSRSPEELSSLVGSALHGQSEDAALVACVATWLLENQFIISPEIPGTWRVVRGVGMGLEHRSAVADIAFLHQVDRMVLQPAFQRAYHMRKCWRYRNGILLIIHQDSLGSFEK
jgi:hypothetical protein